MSVAPASAISPVRKEKRHEHQSHHHRRPRHWFFDRSRSRQPAAQGGVQVHEHSSFAGSRPSRADADAGAVSPGLRSRPIVVAPPLQRCIANAPSSTEPAATRDHGSLARMRCSRSSCRRSRVGTTTVSAGRDQVRERPHADRPGEQAADARAGCIDIDLNGNVRNVTGIMIYGSGRARAASSKSSAP